jgi:hypothetical protein
MSWIVKQEKQNMSFLYFGSPWKKYFSVTSYDHAFCGGGKKISDMRQ